MPRGILIVCEGCAAETLQPIGVQTPRGWLLRRVVDETLMANGHVASVHQETVFCARCALKLKPQPEPSVLEALKGATS